MKNWETSPSHWKQHKEKKFNPNAHLLILFLVLIFVLSFIPSHISYSRDAYLTDRLYEDKLCAFKECPNWITQNHELPEKYSKKWWNVYCTQMPEKCIY